AFRFVTAALNGWVRITAITATSLTFDNRPTGWTTETGTALTIKFWFGGYVRNGTTATSLSLEKGFLDQTTPTYIVNTGMQVNDFNLDIKSKAKITGSFSFIGMGGSQSTTALDASPDAVTTGLVLAANANVGRVAENETGLTDPNWAESLSLKFSNNLRTMESIDSTSPVGVNPGEFTASGEINTYFGSNSLLAKLYTATSTSINCRVTKTTASVPQAIIFTLPTVYLRGGGNPQATGKNTDTMANFSYTASINTTYNCSAQIDRIPYFEA
ncbi:MAG: phage tail tube protein, partial [Armatimonadota bacterium]|nr:phage tail tube protein [Armatimonadota bacterium]